jgi:hypothetical protein
MQKRWRHALLGWLGPPKWDIGLQEKNVRPSKASGSCHMCHLAHNCLHRVHLTLGDVRGHIGDVVGLARPTFKGKGKTPLGPSLPSCLWWNVLLSLRCKPLVYACPWLGSQHPSGGILALWRSELIISPYVPVCRVWSCNNNKYALHGLISHRDHSNVNHI